MRFNIKDLIYVSFAQKAERYITLEDGNKKRINIDIPQFNIYELAVINKDKTAFIPISKFKEQEIYRLTYGCKKSILGGYNIKKTIVKQKYGNHLSDGFYALFFPCNSFINLDTYDIKKQQIDGGFTLKELDKINYDIQHIQINNYCDKIIKKSKKTDLTCDSEQYQNF